eukprot:EG_transcript_34287
MAYPALQPVMLAVPGIPNHVPRRAPPTGMPTRGFGQPLLYASVLPGDPMPYIPASAHRPLRSAPPGAPGFLPAAWPTGPVPFWGPGPQLKPPSGWPQPYWAPGYGPPAPYHPSHYRPASVQGLRHGQQCVWHLMAAFWAVPGLGAGCAPGRVVQL